MSDEEDIETVEPEGGGSPAYRRGVEVGYTKGYMQAARDFKVRAKIAAEFGFQRDLAIEYRKTAEMQRTRADRLQDELIKLKRSAKALETA